jgi:hypothetical protein
MRLKLNRSGGAGGATWRDCMGERLRDQGATSFYFDAEPGRMTPFMFRSAR